jgi:hypothetical protein
MTAYYTSYNGSFVATTPATVISFLFRNDPDFITAKNFSVIDNTTFSSNLLTNGDFATNDLTGWTYANINNAAASGIVQNNTWYDGSVQAYDSISQTLSLILGDTYTISFDAKSLGAPVYKSLSDNGDVTSEGGNGINILAYASDSAITLNGTVPEPTSIALLGIGLFSFAASRRKKNQA